MNKVLILHTGGTLSMSHKEDGSLFAQELKNVLNDFVPELNLIAEITHKQLFSIDSSHMNIENIQLIAETLYQNREDYDGFVITHGTDTMAYTASALSFMFRGFNKPIVLTGAQRPLNKLRTDAKINLIDATMIASRSEINETMIVFDSNIFRGCRATKHKISEYDAFRSFNFPLLGNLGVDITYNKAIIKKKSKKFIYYPKLNSNIIVFKVYPGIFLNRLTFQEEPDAIILEVFGAGNMAFDQNLIDYMKAHKDTPIIIYSQVAVGKVNLNLYESGKIMKSFGAIGSGNITFEALIFKVMHLLSYTSKKKNFLRNITKNLVGELDQ